MEYQANPRIPSVQAGSKLSAAAWNKIASRLNRPYDKGPSGSSGGGGGGNNVATVTQVIPAATEDASYVRTAGGPVTATLQVMDLTTHVLSDGITVELFSWVMSASKDPADEDSGKLHVFIEQDSHGVWWFTGQDCDPPP